MANIRQAHKALIARILEGDGQASQTQRRSAFANEGLTEPLQTLVEKVAGRASAISDRDVAAALAAGSSEDQVFEVVVCAAVGQATRQFDAASAALESAFKKE